MRRLLSWVVRGVQLVVFAVVMCVVGLPFFVFNNTLGYVRERAEARWPNSRWPAYAEFWVKLLAPVAFVAVWLVILGFAFGWIRDQRRLRGIE